MKQNKYGVYLTHDNVDVNDWMTRSTVLGKIGNNALSCYNYKSGATSLLYIPKNESYGTESFPEPLFMNITAGKYTYSTKTGFIHAVFGGDAFGSDGYDERYAAEFVGSKIFTDTLSNDEAHKIPSEKYALGEDGYLDIKMSNVLLGSVQSENIEDVAHVLDGLMSGKNTVVIGDTLRVVSAMVNALKKLPLKEGANTISFNTAATTAEAAKLSRLSCGSYLKQDAIESLKKDGLHVVDLNAYGERLSSSTARIVLNNGDCNCFKNDCPQHAIDCTEYLYALESAARRQELFQLSAQYEDLLACKNITAEEIDLILSLYSACKGDLGRPNYITIKEAAENCLTNLAAHAIFGKEFLGRIDLSQLVDFLKKVPQLQSDVAADIAENVSPEGIVQLLQICFGHVEETSADSRNAAEWICALFVSEQANAETAIKLFISSIKDKSAFVRLVKLLNKYSDLFIKNLSSKQVVLDKVFEMFKSEEELRQVFREVHDDFKGNTDWLLKKAYVTIKDLDDLNVWIQTAGKLIDSPLKTLCGQFESAFAKYIDKNPVDEQNYSVYERAVTKFGYKSDGLLNAIRKIERRVNSHEAFNSRLEENMSSRCAFVQKERLFLNRKVEDDGEVEKVVYGQIYHKGRSFNGGFLVWLLASFLIGAVTAGLAVMVTHLMDLPWAEFFSTLKNPIKGVPVNALLTGVPFVLSIAVSMLSYALGKKREWKGLGKSALYTLFIVIIPYLTFVLMCGALYYF